MRQPGAIETLERAAELLRELPARAWADYLAGAVPLLAGVLYSAADLPNAGHAPFRCAGDALACAALFLWMNICRVRFAGHLSMCLAESAEAQAASWGVAFSPAAAMLAGVKLFALPFAFAAAIPWAWAVAFFRSVPVTAAEGEWKPAARFATAWQKQNWGILAIVSLFGLAVFVNLLAFVVLLPQLLKMFSGMENEFTRGTGGLSFFVFCVAGGLLWLTLDPFLQAVYAVRCFLAGARESGADLFAAVKQLAVLLAIACVAGSVVQAEPAPRDLDRSIRHVLEERQYDWRLHPAGYEEPSNGVLRRIAHDVRSAWDYVTDSAGKAADWLRRLLESREDPAKQPSRGAPVAPLRWMIYGLLVLIGIGIAIYLWRIRASRTKAQSADGPGAAAPVDLSDGNVAASDLPEDEWLRLARECIARQEYRLALRALFLANLSLLSRAGLLTIAAAKTNREYREELRRRAHSEEVLSAFRENVTQFERAWYGRHGVSEEDVAAFERNVGVMRAHAQ